jgi:uncharacterized protein (DUF433 family)/DNA-binding transcriptional MerR regulator
MVSVLDREMYSEAEAARLLRVPPSTLHYWLEGGDRRGKQYRPIIRVEPRGNRTVTWAEFIEAGWLRTYRRDHHVPMAELRAFVDELRDKFKVPYPLADRRPLVMGRQLVYEAQEATRLDPDYCLVAHANGQLLLTGVSEQFVQRVTWDGDAAVGWRPHSEPDSPVLISPDVRFGRPAVRGVSTEAIWEQSDDGEDVDAIAETYGLTAREVHWALAYENTQRAA